MRRREFIILLSDAAAWVSPARAQEPRKVIGVLTGQSGLGFFADVALPAFLQGLRDAGFVEGRNISIEIHRADGHYDRLPSLAAELVRRDVAAIFANDVPAAFAAKAATETIPIVFVIGADPVKVGLVTSFNRPGGNITGVGLLGLELEGKRLGVLHQFLPGTTPIGVLVNPANPAADLQLHELQKTAGVIK